MSTIPEEHVYQSLKSPNPFKKPYASYKGYSMQSAASEAKKLATTLDSLIAKSDEQIEKARVGFLAQAAKTLDVLGKEQSDANAEAQTANIRKEIVQATAEKRKEIQEKVEALLADATYWVDHCVRSASDHLLHLVEPDPALSKSYSEQLLALEHVAPHGLLKAAQRAIALGSKWGRCAAVLTMVQALPEAKQPFFPNDFSKAVVGAEYQAMRDFYAMIRLAEDHVQQANVAHETGYRSARSEINTALMTPAEKSAEAVSN